MDILTQVRQRVSQGLKIAREGGELSAKAAKLQMQLVNLQRERKTLLSKLGERYYQERTPDAAQPLLGAIESLDVRLKDTQELFVAVQASARQVTRNRASANPTLEMPAELPAIVETDSANNDGWPKA